MFGRLRGLRGLRGLGGYQWLEGQLGRGSRGEAGGGDSWAGGGRAGLGHRLAAAWAWVRAAFGVA